MLSWKFKTIAVTYLPVFLTVTCHISNDSYGVVNNIFGLKDLPETPH